MKTITLKQACDLLDRASYIYSPTIGEETTHHSYGYSEDQYHEFLGLSFGSDKDVNDDNDIRFLVCDNPDIAITGTMMYLVSEGEEKIHLQLFLKPENLEKLLTKKKK